MFGLWGSGCVDTSRVSRVVAVWSSAEISTNTFNRVLSEGSAKGTGCVQRVLCHQRAAWQRCSLEVAISQGSGRVSGFEAPNWESVVQSRS